jgi:hypothetical protein
VTGSCNQTISPPSSQRNKSQGTGSWDSLIKHPCGSSSSRIHDIDAEIKQKNTLEKTKVPARPDENKLEEPAFLSPRVPRESLPSHMRPPSLPEGISPFDSQLVTPAQTRYQTDITNNSDVKIVGVHINTNHNKDCAEEEDYPTSDENDEEEEVDDQHAEQECEKKMVSGICRGRMNEMKDTPDHPKLQHESACIPELRQHDKDNHQESQKSNTEEE